MNTNEEGIIKHFYSCMHAEMYIFFFQMVFRFMYLVGVVGGNFLQENSVNGLFQFIDDG